MVATSNRTRPMHAAAAPLWRCWLAALLLAALLAPMLAGMLPQPALSAEQGLEQALAQSLCSTPSDRDTNGGQEHDGQCQLCVLGCGVCCAAPVADLPAAASDLPRGSPRSIVATAPEAFRLSPAIRPLQPRAPPSSLT